MIDSQNMHLGFSYTQVTQDELLLLPRWAQVAFIARVARRALPLYNIDMFPTNDLRAIEEAVSLAEKAAQEGQCLDPEDYYQRHGRLLGKLSNNYGGSMWSRATAGVSYGDMRDLYNVLSIVEVTRVAFNSAIGYPPEYGENRERVARDIFECLRVNLPDKNIRDLILRDFTLLSRESQRLAWKDSTSVSPRFFSLRSEFDWHSLVDVVPLLTDELVRYIRERPSRLRKLTPRQFEELIAELWRKFGFLVELTQPTRDMGRDIVAIRESSGKAKYLIECKRHSKDNPVGISIVQRLNGVVQLEGANKGIIVTTSSFTRPALRVIESTWFLEGKDLEGICGWLDVYQTIQMYRELGIEPPVV